MSNILKNINLLIYEIIEDEPINVRIGFDEFALEFNKLLSINREETIKFVSDVFKIEKSEATKHVSEIMIKKQSSGFNELITNKFSTMTEEEKINYLKKIKGLLIEKSSNLPPAIKNFIDNMIFTVRENDPLLVAIAFIFPTLLIGAFLQITKKRKS